MNEFYKKIDNKPYSLGPYLRRLQNSGFLLISLSKKELKTKYSKAFLGLAWVFLQPLMAVIIYSLFFNSFIKIDTGDVPYVQFVFSGLVFWYLFTGIVTKGCSALLESQDLIHKVSFPRIILLVAKSVPIIIEGLVMYIILLSIVLVTGNKVSFQIIWSLLYFISVLVFAFSLAILFSILVVKVRDILQVVPFIINFGIWLTPVFYPVSIVPPQYQPYIKYLNPLANSIEGLRDSLFMAKGMGIYSLLLLVLSLVLLFISFLFFIKFEKKMVEKL